jgi:hypothetical protein
VSERLVRAYEGAGSRRCHYEPVAHTLLGSSWLEDSLRATHVLLAFPEWRASEDSSGLFKSVQLLDVLECGRLWRKIGVFRREQVS